MASDPIEVTELEMIIEVKPLQPKKASYPILVTLLGMVMGDVSPLQSLKAEIPILVTPLPNVTDFSPLQFVKAE